MLFFLAWDYECVVVLTSITQLSAFCKDIHDYKHIDKNQTEMVWNWEIWYISNHERSPIDQWLLFKLSGPRKSVCLKRK